MLLQLSIISVLLLVTLSIAAPVIFNATSVVDYVLPSLHENVGHSHKPLNSTEMKVITWDYAYRYGKHGVNGAFLLTQLFGKHNLTPTYDAKTGPSDWLYPTLLHDALSMYKITQDKKYLDYARGSADSIKIYMLNEKDIIRMYSYRNGTSDTEPTNLNFYVLPSIAELALYDPSYRPLAERVADGIINYGISKSNIPYRKIYPQGTAADTVNGLPSNGYTISITVTGLLRTYEATGDERFLNKSHDILLSIWNNKRSVHNLIPRMFDAVTLKTVYNDTQLYSTGELLRQYIYYYYLTKDSYIKDIISVYSAAAYDAYWARTPSGQGYFVYRVDVETGKPSNNLLEANWHKLDMSLIYAGEITGRNYKDRVNEDMNTFWLGKGLVYRNYLFRHGTKPDGRPAKNTQSLIYASLRTAIYVMLRMLNEENISPSNEFWNKKVWNHANFLRLYHFQQYGYHSDVDVETLKPDANYEGLQIGPACGEFASLVTLIFRTTPNVKMAWETFPSGNLILEPFPESYSADNIGFMRDVFMDYAHKEIAFKNIISEGRGKIYCSQKIIQVKRDGQTYTDWDKNTLNVSDGKHEYIFIFEGGNFTPPKYP
jgi:hypothetical protein